VADKRLVNNERFGYQIADSPMARGGQAEYEAGQWQEPWECIEHPQDPATNVGTHPGTFERVLLHDSQTHEQLAKAPTGESGE
jgi:hypothetical protein